VEHTFFLQILQKIFKIFAAELFIFFKGQLEGRAFDVMPRF